MCINILKVYPTWIFNLQNLPCVDILGVVDLSRDSSPSMIAGLMVGNISGLDVTTTLDS